MTGFPSCPICGDVIGVYEPLLVRDAANPRPSSIAREPELASGDFVLVHRQCAETHAEPGASPPHPA